MMKPLLLLCCVAAVATAPSVSDSSANNYIDRVLATLQLYMKKKGLDPLPIPDQVAEFSKRVLLVTVWGSASLTNGRLHGLSTIHRVGRSSLRMRGSKLEISASVAVDNMWGVMDARAEFMGVGKSARLGLAIKRTVVSVKISADLRAGKTSPSLDDFSIKELSKIVVRFSGLGVLDWIINPVTNFIVNSLTTLLKFVLERQVAQLLREVLAEVELPLPLKTAALASTQQ